MLQQIISSSCVFSDAISVSLSSMPWPPSHEKVIGVLCVQMAS